MTNHSFSIIIEKDKNGYFAKCLELQGCYTEGRTYEEALENIKNAISLCLEDLAEKNELDPTAFAGQISLTTVPVAFPA